MATNEQNETLSPEAGDSSHPAQDSPDLLDTLVSLQTEEDPSGKTLTAGQENGKEKEEEEEGESSKKKVNQEEDDRLDKHPRFKELIQKNQLLEQELSNLKKELKELKPADKNESTDKKKSGEDITLNKYFDYEDISNLKVDDALEKFSENPVNFLANFGAQIADEILQHVERLIEHRDRTKSEESAIDRTYREFAEQNPDFVEKWDSGEIQRFMKKHPGHNAISAYLMMISKDKEKSLEERLRQEIKAELEKEKEKKQKELAAKHQARTLRPSAGVPAWQSHAEDLKNTAQYGGLINALAGKLKQMRQTSTSG